MNLDLDQPVRIFGIDPGNVNTGIAVVEFRKDCTERKLKFTATLDSTDPDLIAQIANLATRYKPVAISCEDAFIGPNKASAAKLLVLIGKLEQLFEAYPMIRPTATTGNSVLGLHAKRGSKITDKMKKEAAATTFGVEFKTPHEASAAAIAVAGLDALQDELLRFGHRDN